MRRLEPDHRTGLPEPLHGIQQQTAELDHRDVAGAKSLGGAIGDPSHRLPHGDVLVGDARQPREVAGLHRRAVLQVVVGGMAQDRTEIRIHLDARTHHVERPPGLLGDHRIA